MKQADVQVGVDYAHGIDKLGGRWMSRVTVTAPPANRRAKVRLVSSDGGSMRQVGATFDVSVTQLKGTWAEHEQAALDKQTAEMERERHRDDAIQRLRAALPDGLPLPEWIESPNPYSVAKLSGTVHVDELVALVEAAHAHGRLGPSSVTP